jgi:SAM-dependent methyltransferase
MSEPTFYEDYWVKPGDAGDWTPDLGGTNPDEEKLFTELLRPGMNLIDYGCGNGERYGLSMAERGVTYHGFDISKTALEHAAQLGLNVKAISPDSSIPFPDESADVAICFEVLEHLLEPDTALATIRRALKPGAHAILSVPNAANYAQRLEFLFTGFLSPGGSPHTARRAPWRDPHIRFFCPKTLRQLAEASGFEFVKLHAQPFTLTALPYVYRKMAWHPFLNAVSKPFGWLSRLFPGFFSARLFAVVRKPVA